MKRILFIAHDSKVEGGANRSLMSIIYHFNQNPSYKVFVLVPNAKGDFNDWLNQMNIEYISWNYNWQLVDNAKNKKYFLRTLKLFYLFFHDFFSAVLLALKLKQYNVDLLYTNTRVIYVGSFLALIMKKPHIMHVREFILEVMHRRSIFFSEKFLNKSTDRFIFISEGMRKVYRDLDPQKTKVILNGIDTNRNNFFKYPQKNLKLLITGRLGEVKGQKDAIYAVYYLNKKYAMDAELFIAGSGGDKAYNSELKKMTSNLKLENCVHFLGEIQDIYSLRKEMNAEIVCSRFEAFGRVTIEAMSCGLIVFGADATATNEIIRDGENGILYPVGNAEELANKIYLVFKNKDISYKLSNNAYCDAKCNYDTSVMLNNVNNTINEVLNRYSLLEEQYEGDKC